MLLIRGIGSEEHARQIEQGIVGCRDVASILLDGIGETGYLNSNYHEWLLQQSLFGIQGRIPSLKGFPSIWGRLLRTALDPLLMGSYLTYFHIFDPDITKEWLDEYWDDDAHFIFYEPHFEFENHRCVCGACYCGAPITYVNTPEEVSPRETVLNNPALIALLNNDIDSSTDQELILGYISDCIMLLTPLFNRVKEKRFDDRENEFRIYVREPRRLTNDGVRLKKRVELQVACDGKKYRLDSLLETTGIDADLFGDLDNPTKLLELAWATKRPFITSQFKSLDITDTAHNYGYIGNKEDCRKFIKDFSTPVHPSSSYAGKERRCHSSPSTTKLGSTIIDIERAKQEESSIFFRPPDKGCFSRYGAGFKESKFQNPIELGLFSPQAAFASAIKFLIGTEFPKDASAFPRGFSREFLHSSIDPWMPAVVMRQISGSSVFDEIQQLKKGRVKLEHPTGAPKFKDLFDLGAIEKRLNTNLTPENMDNYFTKMLSRPNLPISTELCKSIAATTMSNFASTKHKMIQSILKHLPEGYDQLISLLRCATFDSYDECAAGNYLADANGIVAIYELDPDKALCNCRKSTHCDGRLLFSLTPSIHPEKIDLSKFSYAISSQMVWEDYMIGAGYAIQQTALCLASHPTNATWTISCSKCPKLSESDEPALRLYPKKIVCGKYLDSSLEATIYEDLSNIVEVTKWE